MTDGNPPESIQRAVDMLNNPWDYEEVFKHNLPDSRTLPVGSRPNSSDPRHRIEAKAEWVRSREHWGLYVVWDDSEPLTARFIVHRAIRECGLESFISAGGSSNHEFGDGEKKFPHARNPDVSYLRVAPTEDSVRYECSECGEASGRVGGSVNLSFSLD